MGNLTLRVSLNNGSLDVDQSGNANEMGHGQTGTITWELTGNAASGSFNAMNAGNPGFAWKQPPPNGVFGTPGVVANGNQIQMTDNNNDPNGTNSTGTWIYQLYATIGGNSYSTIASFNRPTAVTTNPTIKNT